MSKRNLDPDFDEDPWHRCRGVVSRFSGPFQSYQPTKKTHQEECVTGTEEHAATAPAHGRNRLSRRWRAAVATYAAMVTALAAGLVVIPGAAPAGAAVAFSTVTGFGGSGTAPSIGAGQPEGTAKISPTYVARNPLNGDIAVASTNGGSVYVYLIAGTSGGDRYHIQTSTGGSPAFGPLVAQTAYIVAGTGSSGLIGEPGNNQFGNSTSVLAVANTIEPDSVAFDAAGNLLIAGTDGSHSAIQMVAQQGCSSACPYGLVSMTAGGLYTIADVGVPGAPGTAIDMGGVVANGAGMSVDSSGDIVVGDVFGVQFVNEHTSASVSAYGTSIPPLSSVAIAGNARGGNDCTSTTTASALANSLRFQNAAPFIDASGNVYFSDNEGGTGTGCAWVEPAHSGSLDGMSVTAGKVYKIAGNGGTSATADGIPANTANVAGTSQETVDPAGNIVLAVQSGTSFGSSPAIQVVAESSGTYYGVAMTAGDIYTIAGGPTNKLATLTGPTSVLSDNGTGDLFFTDGATASANLDEITGGQTPVPVVSSVNPNSGSATGGTSVVISSSVPNFTGATAVTFGTTPATAFSVNSTGSQIAATAPAGSGTVDITVTTPGPLTSAVSSADQFTFVPAPTVTSINPTSGPAGGGTSVTITGSNLQNATAVDFGTSNPGTVTADASGSITVTSPSGSGTPDVTVTTPGGTSATSANDVFTYIPAPVVTMISPTSGPATGGTSVTITGSNLENATAVDFGTSNPGTVTADASGSITVTSPSGSGTPDVTVTTPGGTSATSANDVFTYIPAPVVTMISPTSGPTGGATSVTITGSNLANATAVDFGTSNPGTVTADASGSITVTSPSGSGIVDVTVTTPGGTSATSPNDKFTYVPAPVVTLISPTSGPATGGTSVTITGSNLENATAVDFGTSNPGTVTADAPGSITVTSPSGSGTPDVTVTTPGGTSATSANDVFTYIPAPTVTSLSPGGGPAAGGTSVTITGTNFTGETAVKFGTVAATGVVVNGAGTSISATSPAGTGMVDVTVTTPGGTSATSTADHFIYEPPPPAGATQSAGAASNSPTGTATASLPGNSISASFTGVGAVTVAQYGGNPTTGAVSGGTGMYFDVKVATGSTMPSLTITVCSLGSGGQSIDWWNGSAWVPFSNQTFNSSTGCVTATVNASGTSPTIGQLSGTPVAASSNSLSSGYWLVASDGGIFSYGGAGFFGSTGGMTLNKPIVGMASTPDGKGYWLVASDGGIFSYGDATFYGSTGSIALNKPIVGMASTPDGKGYWLVASDGGIFSYGDATFFGSTGGIHLNKPVVGMTATKDGKGYWLVASDGGIFSYGDATFHGSTGGIALNKPVVGMTATKDGQGYWLVASDGGIFSYGDATFHGSTGGIALNKPVVGMTATTDGQGYWLVASDGGIFSYGDATFAGSTGGMTLNKPIVGMAAQPGGS